MVTSNQYLIIGFTILVLFYLFIRYQFTCIIDEKIEKSHKRILKKIYMMYKKFNQQEQQQQSNENNQYYQQQEYNYEKEIDNMKEQQNDNDGDNTADNDSVEDIGYSAANQGNGYASFSN